MKLKVTQIRSTIGRKEDQKRTVVALGLGRIGKSREHDDNPVIRGMIQAVKHLLKVEEMAGEPVAKPARKKAAKKVVKPAPIEAVEPVEVKADFEPTAAMEEITEPIKKEEVVQKKKKTATSVKKNIEKKEPKKAASQKAAAPRKKAEPKPVKDKASDDKEK